MHNEVLRNKIGLLEDQAPPVYYEEDHFHDLVAVMRQHPCYLDIDISRKKTFWHRRNSDFNEAVNK